MANDQERLTPAPVGSKDAYHLQISDGGVVMPGNLGDMIEFARMMAKADIAIPKHLRGNAGACLAVAMRARSWMMDPFAIATKTYAVNDILAYEAQLIVAVINKFAPIVGRLVPRYEGEGPTLKCFIEPKTRDDGQVLPYESPEVKDIGVKNSPLWKNDVRQQLFYSSARAWARRYYPELLLGVYDVEEARSMKDVTPKPVQNSLIDEDEPAQVLTGETLEPEHTMADAYNQDGFSRQVAKDAETLAETETAREEARTTAPQLPIEDEADPVEETIITPELIAENMIKSIGNSVDLKSLEAWQKENLETIKGLPKDLAAKVRKAYSSKYIDLDGGM